MKLRLTLLTIAALFASINNWVYSQEEQRYLPGYSNLVYGEKHIFTVETPVNWINDKTFSRKVGLVDIFFAHEDSSVKHKSYMYAIGFDKIDTIETLDGFISSILNSLRTKHPNFEFKPVPIENNEGVNKKKMYTFSHLTDKLNEHVLYIEEEESFTVFSFSVLNESDDKKYMPVFKNLIKSYKYRGKDPKPLLEYLEKTKN